MNDNNIEFMLGNELVQVTDCHPNMTILEYLRHAKGLTGTKEGCASGDCGACTVVIGKIINEQLVYQQINSCIAFIGSLQGKQLLTIEHLQHSAELHSVQQAFVDQHASQCGFCTPGFVMSTFALQQQYGQPNLAQIHTGLAGNLCRCTGYRSIVDAALSIPSPTKDQQSHPQIMATLQQINRYVHYTESSGAEYIAPQTVQQLADYLIANPDAHLLAGGTDLALMVTQQLDSLDKLVYLGNVNELTMIEQEPDQWRVGAAVTYEDFVAELADDYPEMVEMITRIGSTHIRNVATIAGNIANASPIGDMSPVLIALGASVELQRGEQRRVIAVEDFFKDYKVTALARSEFIRSVLVPKPVQAGDDNDLTQHFRQLKVYKVSKRIDDDISAVLAAIHIEISDQKVVAVRIAFGGMAAIPKRAIHCEQALLNRVWQAQTITEAQLALQQDFSPWSDVRGSQAYRLLVAQNLLEKCFIEWQQRPIATRVIHYA